MAEIEVIVCRGGREVGRVRRPLRQGPDGPAITYRRKLWPVIRGRVELEGEAMTPKKKTTRAQNTSSTALKKMLSTVPIRSRSQHGNGAGKHPPTPTKARPVARKKQQGDAAQPDRDRAGSVAAPTLDTAQERVINRPESARILVDAGPGTGKTHVACARVAALIGMGVPAARIWLISFTRTAVAEVRARIKQALADPGEAASVCIATLDSKAWELQSGFKSDARLTGSFDENIEGTLRQVNENSDLREYLAGIKHLIVDEAQDIVGARADLIEAIIAALSPDCGVTVFADEAQAIYGFSEEEEDAEDGETLLERLRGGGFEEVGLTAVYRTSRPNLLAIATEVRRKVLRRGRPTTRRKQIANSIRENADDSCGPLKHLELAALQDVGLVLARRRFEVLMLSSMQQHIPHRLRLSGLPPCLEPWIGHLLWDFTARYFPRSELEPRWQARNLAAVPGSPSLEAAWQLLVEAAGKDERLIDLHQLRKVLGRSSPPMLFCAPEFGQEGPILGTIHASKGREADGVALFLPHNAEDARDPEEEIRVLFVGATRARWTLLVGEGDAAWAGSMNGRVFRNLGAKGIQVEIGRTHDLTAEGLVGRSTFQQQEQALAAQERWRHSPVQRDLCAHAAKDLGWSLALADRKRTRLAAFSPALMADLRAIAHKCGAWQTPSFFPHLRSLGARTVVLPPESPHLEALHEPWRTSGFLLAPLLLGFSTWKPHGQYLRVKS